MNNIKCWKGRRAGGIHTHCWWEWKMVPTLWKTVWQYLIKLKICLPYDLESPSPGTDPRQVKLQSVQRQNHSNNLIRSQGWKPTIKGHKGTFLGWGALYFDSGGGKHLCALPKFNKPWPSKWVDLIVRNTLTYKLGTSLAVQGLRPPSSAGVANSIPGWRANTPHDWWPENQNIKQKQYCKKLNKDLKKIKLKMI